MEWIEKLAQAVTFQRYGLEKMARTRFLELAEKGLLSAADMKRLGITDKFMAATGKQKNRMVKSLRGKLYGAATDVRGRQLANHRTLAGKLEDAVVARHGAVVPNSPMGPGASVGGNVIMSGDLGNEIQKLVKPLPKRDVRALGPIQRSIVDHEVAESAMAAGGAERLRQQGLHAEAGGFVPSNDLELNALRTHLGFMDPTLGDKANLLHPGTTHAYEAKPFASHIGPAALVAEAQSTFRDPAASKYMIGMRQKAPDDAYTMKKMKQFGHTPAYPMPLGGKQHFALDEAVANISADKLDESALANRMRMKGVMIPKGAAKSLEKAREPIEAYEKAGLIDATMARRMHADLDKEIARIQKLEGVRSRPYTNPQEARQRHMALFAAPRNDANPGRRI